MNIKKILFLSIGGVFCFLILLLYGGASLMKSVHKDLVFLRETKPKIINIFQDDKDIFQINKKGLLLRNNLGWCLMYSKNTSEICGQKIQKYFDILDKIPDGHNFYSCRNDVLIEQVSDLRYYVRIPHSKKKILNGYPNETWLSYKYSFDVKQDINPCYPWDNLEDYWKRYGKASPEEIQAVIDKGNEK